MEITFHVNHRYTHILNPESAVEMTLTPGKFRQGASELKRVMTVNDGRTTAGVLRETPGGLSEEYNLTVDTYNYSRLLHLINSGRLKKGEKKAMSFLKDKGNF